MKTKIGFYTRTIALCLLLTCAERGPNSVDRNLLDEFQLKGSIAGHVIDERGVAVSGVSVTIDSAGFTTTSDTSGNFRIPNVSAGTYRITLSHASYFDTTLDTAISLVVDEDIINMIFVILRNPLHFPGSISGTINGIRGTLLSGASITLDSLGTTTTSDTAGNFFDFRGYRRISFFNGYSQLLL